MKKVKRFLILAVLTLTMTVVFTGEYRAAYSDYTDDPREEMALMSIGYDIVHEDYESAYSQVLYLEIRPQVLANFLSSSDTATKKNKFLELYGEEIKTAGCLPADYVLPGSSADTAETNTEPTPAPEPEAFTVEDIEPKTMWATGAVNLREGASTDYTKVGSLEKYEEVTVNGIASTGWYRIVREDGSNAYVSNKFLSEENPSDRTEYIYNEETGKVDTIEFTDTDPEVIDKIVEEMKTPEEPEPVVEEETPVAEETVETQEPVTMEDPEEVVEETVIEQEPTFQPPSYSKYLWLTAVIVCGFGVIAMLLINRKKK